MAYLLLFSCFLYWSWGFFWIGYIWWCGFFMWIWKTFPAAQWASHLGKMLWYGKKIKSMSETSVDFSHLEFPRFHQTVLCWAASLEYPSQCLAGWSLFCHGSPPSCGMCYGFLANTTQMMQSAHCSKCGLGLVGFSYSAVPHASHKLKELQSQHHILLCIPLCFAVLGCFLQCLVVVGALLHILRCKFVSCKTHRC